MIDRIIHFIDRNARLIAIATLSILFLLFLYKGAIPSADSQSYIQKDIIRSPLYPLFISSIGFFFGQGNYFFLVVFQLLFGFFAVFKGVETLRKLFNLNGLVFLVLLILFLTPYSYWYGNLILSEGLAYPLFLLSVSALLESLLLGKKKQYYLFSLYILLLVLTRQQYLFLYIVGFIAFLYFMLQKTHKMGLLLALILSFGACDILERSYHYYYHDKFIITPFLGVQLLTMPLYLSSPDDVKLFNDPIQASIFKNATAHMEDKRCNANSVWIKSDHPEYCHFYLNYNNVSWGSISNAFAENNLTDWSIIDKTLVAMSWPLMKAHWARNLSLYLRNVIHSMGGYYIFSFILFSFITAFCFHWKQRDRLSLGLFFAILMSYGNYFSVAIVEPAMTRYTFSTNIILTSFLMIAIYILCKYAALIVPSITSNNEKIYE